MTDNEAKTRREIIDKRLLKAGWNVKEPSQVITELDIWVGLPPWVKESQSEYQGHLFADYALLGKDQSPIAVVEAKKTSIDPRVGKEQARNYAEKIQKNTGKEMPLVMYTNGHDIYFWDTERYPPRKVYGFPTKEDLERLFFLRNNSKPLSRELINKDTAGRPYQIQAIRSILESIQKKRRKFLLVMATGTGKTRVCIALLDVLMRANWTQKVLFLVDRVALRRQALDAFKDHLPNAPIWPKDGEWELNTDRRVYVATYPRMLSIIESDNCPLSLHFFDMIVADESHRSIYNVYKNIFDYFDAMQIGLTATPTNVIDHNTFQLFECEDGLPSFAYSYEEAVTNIPPYLNNFEVLKIRTKFQQDGINTKTIALAEQKRLIAEGKDPDEINYEGTDLEKRVTNKGTNALIVREFMEDCIKDPNGVLPGKTIFFAITQKHAQRLCDAFNALYPEYKGQLAEVITSKIERVHGKGGLLDRFKNQDMPRVALSVDMLDTGIDILEIVNLVFAKPVFSYTKFWQMIGRGTRILDKDKIKTWCTEKDKFLIMDCWDNFEYFSMNPPGKETKPQIALPIRRFNARIDKLIASGKSGNDIIHEKVINNLRNDIQSLPQNSVIVLEAMITLDLVRKDEFWISVDETKIEYLRTHISPLMRALSGVDFKAMRFEIDIIELATAHLLKQTAKSEALRDEVVEQVSQLPLSVNIVARERELIEKVLNNSFWLTFTDDDLDVIIQRLAPLMRYRQIDLPGKEEKLNLTDLLVVKEFVEFGPYAERLTVENYRQQVEAMIHILVESNPLLQKLKAGKDLTDSEIEQLAESLHAKEPYITEELLQKVYDNKKAGFIQFIKYILGLEELSSFTGTVSKAFDEFIAKHNTYGELQIQFLLTLKTFVLQREKIERKDLVHAPFTQLHPNGIRGIFPPKDAEEVLQFTYELLAQ